MQLSIYLADLPTLSGARSQTAQICQLGRKRPITIHVAVQHRGNLFRLKVKSLC